MKKRLTDFLREDAPTNNVGSGAVAGAGVGPQGEPGAYQKKRRKRALTLSRTLFARRRG